MNDYLSYTGIVVLIALALIIVPIAAVCLENNSRKGSKIAKKRIWGCQYVFRNSFPKFGDSTFCTKREGFVCAQFTRTCRTY